MATENAVSALGKVLEGHSASLAPPDAAQAWGAWAGSLPLVEDKVEARAVHAQLVRLIEASDDRSAFLGSRVLGRTLAVPPWHRTAHPLAWRAAVLCMHAAWYP